MRFFLLFASVCLVAACTDMPPTPQLTAVAPLPSHPPVPALLDSSVPKPPVSGSPLSWQPAHWEWTGHEYVWQKGAWIDRAGHPPLWQIGYWQLSAGQWVWIPAHWTN